MHERAGVHRAEEAVEYGFEFEEPGHTGLRVAPTLVLQLAAVAVRTQPVEQQRPLAVRALADELEADEAGVALPDAPVALAAGALAVPCALDDGLLRNVHRHSVVLHQRDAFLKRNVHERTRAGGVATRQREQDAGSRMRRRLMVREALAHAVRRILREAHAVHQPARGLRNEVGRLPIGARAARAEPRYACVDEAGVDAPQRVSVEERRRSGVVLDEHVRRGHEAFERLSALRALPVERYAAPAPVEVEEVQARRGVAAHERRETALVRATRRLDVEHVRAEVCEEFRAVRAGLARQGDDADVVQRRHAVSTPGYPALSMSTQPGTASKPSATRQFSSPGT